MDLIFSDHNGFICYVSSDIIPKIGEMVVFPRNKSWVYFRIQDIKYHYIDGDNMSVNLDEVEISLINV